VLYGFYTRCSHRLISALWELTGYESERNEKKKDNDLCVNYRIANTNADHTHIIIGVTFNKESLLELKLSMFARYQHGLLHDVVYDSF